MTPLVPSLSVKEIVTPPVDALRETVPYNPLPLKSYEESWFAASVPEKELLDAKFGAPHTVTVMALLAATVN